MVVTAYRSVFKDAVCILTPILFKAQSADRIEPRSAVFVSAGMISIDIFIREEAELQWTEITSPIEK